MPPKKKLTSKLDSLRQDAELAAKINLEHETIDDRQQLDDDSALVQAEILSRVDDQQAMIKFFRKRYLSSAEPNLIIQDLLRYDYQVVKDFLNAYANQDTDVPVPFGEFFQEWRFPAKKSKTEQKKTFVTGETKHSDEYLKYLIEQKTGRQIQDDTSRAQLELWFDQIDWQPEADEKLVVNKKRMQTMTIQDLDGADVDRDIFDICRNAINSALWNLSSNDYYTKKIFTIDEYSNGILDRSSKQTFTDVVLNMLLRRDNQNQVDAREFIYRTAKIVFYLSYADAETFHAKVQSLFYTPIMFSQLTEYEFVPQIFRYQNEDDTMNDIAMFNVQIKMLAHELEQVAISDATTRTPTNPKIINTQEKQAKCVNQEEYDVFYDTKNAVHFEDDNGLYWCLDINDVKKLVEEKRASGSLIRKGRYTRNEIERLQEIYNMAQKESIVSSKNLQECVNIADIISDDHQYTNLIKFKYGKNVFCFTPDMVNDILSNAAERQKFGIKYNIDVSVMYLQALYDYVNTLDPRLISDDVHNKFNRDVNRVEMHDNIGAVVPDIWGLVQRSVERYSVNNPDQKSVMEFGDGLVPSIEAYDFDDEDDNDEEDEDDTTTTDEDDTTTTDEDDTTTTDDEDDTTTTDEDDTTTDEDDEDDTTTTDEDEDGKEDKHTKDTNKCEQCHNKVIVGKASYFINNDKVRKVVFCSSECMEKTDFK